MAVSKKTKVVLRKLGREKAFGLAHFDDNKIEIDPRQRTLTYLDTLIHEKLHLLNPDWSESKVKKHAREITTLLWEHGYRWVELK